ncbi:hypothetical protein [Ralstonia pickettii]|nr:hypothetical protein [Ralstonia pickettii]MBA9846740.1 hypothetical protein [Ralstonia pickettii]MBA9852108.1 hypothetical protein [Ralstonia pickettii]MBA9919877.1 hypothetical protein [Ralstonia pickettii]MBA9958979.1 hypothetical protein [Ralstonia pickettii]MBA9964642.1 hypothetical protein [Ralstonia pickettii]
MNMQYEHIPYETFGDGGEDQRGAREIGELPWEMRAQALKDATTAISGLIGQPAAGLISIESPVYLAFDMGPEEANRHAHADILLKLGTHISLSYCNKGGKATVPKPSTAQQKIINRVKAGESLDFDSKSGRFVMHRMGKTSQVDQRTIDAMLRAGMLLKDNLGRCKLNHALVPSGPAA